MTDLELAIAKLRALGGIAPDVLTAVHLGVPVPKERARQGPHGFYTPTRTKDAQQALAWTLRQARGRRAGFTDTVAIVAVFYVPSFQRKDTDNCMKLVMDAATKAGVWRDDSQVRAEAVFFEYDERAPRTVVAICPYLCSLSKTPLLTAADERAG